MPGACAGLFWSFLLKPSSFISGLWGLALTMLLLSLPLAGCGSEEEEDALAGPFGEGAGGTAVDAGQVVLHPFTNSVGETPGAMEYDSSYFFAVADPAGSSAISLTNSAPPAGDGTALAVVPIVGRADTACRYLAAVMMRDQGYEFVAAGERINNNELEFYQVDIIAAEVPVSLFCAIFRDNQGVMIQATAPGWEPLGYLQMHFLLNSLVIRE